MRSSLPLLATACTLTLMSGCETAIFNATFDNDVLGAAPALSPPGDPPGDSFELSDTPPTVFSPPADPAFSWNHTEQSLLLDNLGTTQVTVDAHPDNAPHTSGRIHVRFIVEPTSKEASPLLIKLMGGTSVALAEAEIDAATVKVGDAVVAQPGKDSGPWAVRLTIDLDEATLSGGIAWSEGNSTFGPVALSNSNPSLEFVRFQIHGTPAGGGAPNVPPQSGIYLLDNLSMKVP